MDEKYINLIKLFEKKLFRYKFLLFCKIYKICKDGKKTITQIYKEIIKNGNATMYNLIVSIKLFEELGLVNTEKSGRVKYVYLTDIGREIACCYFRIMGILRKNFVEKGVVENEKICDDSNGQL